MIGAVRVHGDAPRRVAVLHGGPGAPGSAAGLARGISRFSGVIEPFQSRFSIDDLIGELDCQLAGACCFPVVLVGHSWGAWLAGLYAAKFPERVAKVVLVGAGPLEETYVSCIEQCRQARFSVAEAAEYRKLLEASASGEGDPLLLRRLGELCDRVDSCDVEPETSLCPPDLHMYTAIWKEAAALRRSGALLERFCRISAPLVVMHGEWDPHPIAGVVEPLTARRLPFVFHQLPACGHTPWREKSARRLFFELLARELVL